MKFNKSDKSPGKKALLAVDVVLLLVGNLVPGLAGSIILSAFANQGYDMGVVIQYYNYALIALRLICIAVLLIGIVSWKPMENAAVGGKAAPKAKINEEMSDRAQYEYNRLVARFREGALELDEATDAKLFAEAVELQLLKSPASAKFCDLEEITATPSGEGWVVSGFVDSQNSYGAIVRTPFKLNVVKQDGAWKSVDRFISSAVGVQSNIFAGTLIWWILGIIGTIVTYLIIRFTIFDF